MLPNVPKFDKISLDVGQILPKFAPKMAILFGSQEVQKMNMKMEIRKRENG